MSRISWKPLFILCVLFILILLTGCADNPEISELESQTSLLATPTNQSDLQSAEQLSSEIKQTEVAILAAQASSQPSPTPNDQSGPWLSPLISFAIKPDRALARQMFPGGTKQIYAMWEYGNMQPGLTIRREWYRDGKLWIEREEKWDMEKYGSNGTVYDISVYDFDNGLEPGSYLLKLFINDREFRSDGYMSQTFVVNTTEVIEPVLSPDERKTASVDEDGTLLLQSADGTQRIILNDPGITSLAWHPDSNHIFFNSYASSSTPPSPHGFWNELWAINVQTGEQWQLASAEEDLHEPVVSPTGQYLALISGSGFSDACFVDKRLVVLQLNSELRREAVIELADFAGIVTNFERTKTLTSVYPVGNPTWRSNNTLEVELNWTCTTDSPGDVYQLELEELKAVKTEIME